jgi:hypothetical protein
MQYKHIPEVILQLESLGYSHKYCHQRLLQNFREVDLKVFLGAFRRWPLSTIKIVIPFLFLAIKSTFDLLLTSRPFTSIPINKWEGGKSKSLAQKDLG